MRAMALELIAPIAGSPLRLKDVPDPEPGPGQIRVRIRCCAICRTDLHVIEGDLPKAKLPVIPGHQAVGIVERLGPGCARFRPGDRVGIAWLRGTCGSCEYCAKGRENLCVKPSFTGYHEDGGFAELAVAREDFAYAIPPGFDDAQAAPLLCAGIIGFRALRRSELPDGGTLAIFGFGSSAHIVAQIARARGCRVHVVTRGERHRELARRLGAEWVSDTPAGMPAKADSAIVFAPAGEIVPAALEILAPGGTLALAGIHMSDIPSLNYEKHLFHEKNVRSVTANTRRDGEELLVEAAAAGVRAETTAYPLAEANRALQDLKSDRIQGTGILTIG